MIRTTITPLKDSFSVNIPKDYVGKSLEVIVFAREEGLVENKGGIRNPTFSAISIDTLGFKFNRDEANER
ncbi:hypothetical protein BH09BAC1_BH09BAC1_16730 [soil metagenome]